MSRPPRILLPHTVVLLTSRVEQGLPFVRTPLMESILWSALAVAQNLYPLKVISFVIMGNHIHLIVLVEDPELVESFMERFKCETSHAINRLMGRRQVTVWCEGYHSPAILTESDLIEKIAYVYANPMRAHLAESISTYQGVSSWGMLTSGQGTKQVKRIRRPAVKPLPKGRLSAQQQGQLARSVEQRSKETLEFTLTPDAWQVAFPKSLTSQALNQRVLERLQEIEIEMTEIRRAKEIRIPSAHEVISQPIDIPYAPTTFGRRMLCICSDIPRRIAFISLVRYLRAQARNVRMNWLRGDYSEPFPVGLFPPCQPILANLLPAFVRNSLAPV